MTISSPRAVRIAAFALIASLAMLSIPALFSLQASAGIGPLPVAGYVKDQAGRPMGGVPVVVAVKNGSTTVSVLSTTSDSDGFYTVTFPKDDWELGFTLVATATWGGDQVTETITITQEFGEMIDLQFPFEIPQFGTALGFLAVAGAVGVVAVFLLPKRSKTAKQ